MQSAQAQPGRGLADTAAEPRSLLQYLIGSGYIRRKLIIGKEKDFCKTWRTDKL